MSYPPLRNEPASQQVKVGHHHGECFVQASLDRGNSLSSVNKKICYGGPELRVLRQ